MSDSILKRFAATLATNAVGAVVSFLASLLIARTLGPKAYGDFAFLLASFAALNTWFDLGASTAFYTFLSKAENARAHARAYAFWLGARFILVALAIALIPGGWLAGAWLGQPRAVILAAWAAFFASVVLRGYLMQLAESARRTLFAQSAAAVLSLAHLALVAALRLTGAMSLPTLYGLLILEYAGLSAWFLRRYDPAWLGPSVPGPGGRALARRYARYCAPLVGYAFLGFVADFADRWLLQRFAGSAQQGYFALAQQFSAVALLSTTALLNIFWKELASAEAAFDRAASTRLYRSMSKAMFFAAAAGGAFLAPHSRTLIEWTAGARFADAWPTLVLMLTYPAMQSLGQLNGAYFFATEDTKIHVAISSAGLLLGLPLAWLVLAPREAFVPGLALGSFGLAARGWATQAAAVSVQCLVIARRQGGGRGPADHWATLAGLLASSWALAALFRALAAWLGLPRPEVFALAASGSAYVAGVLAVLVRFPGLAGAERVQVDRVLSRLGWDGLKIWYSR